MGQILHRFFNTCIIALLIFQLTGCGTLLYPERRGQIGGRVDVGVAVLDAIGLLFFIIPGVIAFAVDFSNGTIYLPTRQIIVTHVVLKEIKFDPDHSTIAQIEKTIKAQTGYAVDLSQPNVRISRLRSRKEMIEHFCFEYLQSRKKSV